MSDPIDPIEQIAVELSNTALGLLDRKPWEVTALIAKALRAQRAAGEAEARQPQVSGESICKECGCTTGGGDYCYEHAPYMTYPKANGTFLVDSNGRRRVSYDEPPVDKLAEAQSQIEALTRERDKWLDNFNRSEQFQNGPTKRAEAAEAKLAEVEAGRADRRAAFCSNCGKLMSGTWPGDDLRRAFVDGASWWQFYETGATMFASERDTAEAEAEKRYGALPSVPGEAAEDTDA